MVSKQAVALFISVAIAVVAAATFANIAAVEAEQTYDVSELRESVFDLLDTVASHLEEQDDAVNDWMLGVTDEIRSAESEILFFDEYVRNHLNPIPAMK